jgi:predicted RNA binding protein YcfA (HicA-like mRNA interferase family)
VPRKIRQLISDLTRAGFVDRSGKGSHRNFIHEATGAHVTVSGNAGDDAHHYQEKQVRLALSASKRKRK